MEECTVAPRRLRAALAIVASLAVAIVTGCSATPHAATDFLQSTVIERDRVATEAHAANTTRAAVFLRDKWGPVPLPQSGIERWLSAESWAPTLARCLADAGFPGVRSADDGERLDFSALTIIEPRELFEIDVASYDCQARFPVRAWFANAVRDVEAPWAHDYTRGVLVPCLLAAGYEVPPVPDAETFRATWRTDEQFDPYALISDSPTIVARATTRCVPPATILDGAS